MKKVIVETVIASILLLAGIAGVLFVLFTPSLIVTLLSLAALALGIVFALLAKKAHKAYLTPPIAQMPAAESSDEAAAVLTNLINQQNKMVQEWKKTNDTRDKLKLLKIASGGSSS